MPNWTVPPQIMRYYGLDPEDLSDGFSLVGIEPDDEDDGSDAQDEDA